MNRFDSLPEFEKEFKQLLKKYRTLNDDLEKLKQVLLACPTGIGKNFTVLHSEGKINIVKARMACQALRNRSLRVIYAFHEEESKIIFIELYFKGNKETENKKRIIDFIDSLEAQNS